MQILVRVVSQCSFWGERARIVTLSTFTFVLEFVLFDTENVFSCKLQGASNLNQNLKFYTLSTKLTL